MAPPFSGVETAFRVIVDDKSYYANCVWDALGVVAALGRDGEVEASDAFTEEWMSLRIDLEEHDRLLGVGDVEQFDMARSR